MRINRRLFVAGAVASPVAYYLAGLPAFAQPAGRLPAASGASQVVAVQNFRFGSALVTALSDGYIEIDAAALAGIDEAEASSILAERFAGSFPVDAGLNCFLVRSGDETVLVDAGGASSLFPQAGHLVSLLETIGVPAAEIDIVLLTHLHPDHIGALVVDGAPAFENAVVRAHRAEIDFWMDDEAMAAGGDEVAVYFEAARAVVEAYADRLEPFGGGEEVAAGIVSRELFGHTPGHSGFMIGEGEDGLLVWGDVVHIGPVQFERPAIGMVFDVDPQAAIGTRETLLSAVARDRTRVAGMHVSFPGIGHVVGGIGEGSYDFVPERWQYEL